MERLICFAVEGLKRHGWREVWQTLGTYDSAAQAGAAAKLAGGEVLETRIVSCYRVTPTAPRVSVARPALRAARPQSVLHVEA
jgi:hypothetical protein